MDNVISFPSLLVGFEQDVSRIRRMNTRSGRINNILEGTYPVQEYTRRLKGYSGWHLPPLRRQLVMEQALSIRTSGARRSTDEQ